MNDDCLVIDTIYDPPPSSRIGIYILACARLYIQYA